MIFPLAFLTKMQKVLAEGSQGVAIMQQAEKSSYMLALHHAEVVKHKWGGSTHTTVAEVQAKIVALLKEYEGVKLLLCHLLASTNCAKLLGQYYFVKPN
jgi:programmed cell death protein 4